VDGQVPTRLRLAYGVGSVADGVKNATFNAFLVLYYTTVLGLPGTLSGLAIFIALCFDAVSDPLVGSLSDNFHSRFGRRHPFMFFAALPMALCMYALFAPPEGLDQAGLFVWLVTFAIGVRLFLTFYMVPSGASSSSWPTAGSRSARAGCWPRTTRSSAPSPRSWSSWRFWCRRWEPAP
jgi:Na+/melibiose symporter-like transporter